MPGLEHEAARQALEELMTTVFPRDDFIDGLLDQGRAEGEAKGEARVEAKMLLRVLAARGQPARQSGSTLPWPRWGPRRATT